MVDPILVEEVRRAAGDKGKLVGLAKAWYLPFLSQVRHTYTHLNRLRKLH